ncbi:hypothetical protein FNJ84_21210 [Paracoccus sp. M683]|uniref:hypothetical protein n=1 Tax=Paracoccus sp. M683 TaxID=2594268 RepID=UPI001180E212|nr:hypothetical protein [Paracoccus sp. M683]TRW92126.1 hypothetical protein FNJ84_21210 [Paracoccus sp. M683]
MTWLSACGAGGSEQGGAVCPPVVEYPTAVQEKAAAELDTLPENTTLVGMMADYHVLRRQARACPS